MESSEMDLCDVALREGDQVPGRDYTIEQKVTAARELDRLGLEYIQPAFPITGEKDQDIVRQLAGTLEANVVSLARAIPRDVEVALTAGTDVVEIIVPLSDLQLEYTLGKSRAEMLDALDAVVDLAAADGTPVHVGITDAFRTDHRVIREAIERYPDVALFNLADSVGACTPTRVRSHLKALCEHVDLSRIGVHFHDDLGVATANTLAASELGVAKADVSVGGLGERAGNAALEEVVVASIVGETTSVNVAGDDLIPACVSVLETLGENIDSRKPVIGSEVTEHESGMHTAAMLENPSVFEPFDPATFGGERRLLFGSGTGRSGARKLLVRAGIEANDAIVTRFLDQLSAVGPIELEDALELAFEFQDER